MWDKLPLSPTKRPEPPQAPHEEPIPKQSKSNKAHIRDNEDDDQGRCAPASAYVLPGLEPILRHSLCNKQEKKGKKLQAKLGEKDCGYFNQKDNSCLKKGQCSKRDKLSEKVEIKKQNTKKHFLTG